MKKNRKKSKESGQFMLEAVLLMVMFLGVATIMKKSFEDQNLIGKLLVDPWSSVSGMMSNGVWMPEATGHSMHPQGHVMSREGDEQ